MASCNSVNSMALENVAVIIKKNIIFKYTFMIFMVTGAFVLKIHEAVWPFFSNDKLPLTQTTNTLLNFN